MSYSVRLLLALLAVLAGPLAIGLLISSAPLADELIIAGVALTIGSVAALIAARVFARPVRAMLVAVQGITHGGSVAPASSRGDDLARLKTAINMMGEQLRRHQDLVDEAREEVQISVRRLGEVLRSTHDLTALLSVVLETALAAVEGSGGAVFLFQANRSELVAKVARQLPPAIASRRISVGQGLVGWVAEHGRPVVIPRNGLPQDDEIPLPSTVAPEPPETTAIGVPIGDGSHVLGVLAVYGHRRKVAFGQSDLATLTSLARQAAIGIENVQLHEQAQRLSITDGLTSIWNQRYFQMRFAQEFAAAKRFDQQLSVLWIDIDDFKLANDRYGHQRGDAILIELASRISGEIREVDMLARYGGEEFILLLPRIDAEGARVAGERIRSVIADTPFGTDDEAPIKVTVSIGCATYPFDGNSQGVLLEAADKAMYSAKGRGKDMVVSATELRASSGFTRPPTRP